MTETERTTTRPLHELITLIQQWGMDRSIIGNGTTEGQWLKLVSEFGEMADNVAKGESIEDDIGDQFVVLCMILGISGADMDKFYSEHGKTDFENLDDDMATAVCETLYQVGDLYYMMDASQGVETQCAIMVNHLEWLAKLSETTLPCCVEVAYADIKDRTGHLLENGVFVKEEAA